MSLSFPFPRPRRRIAAPLTVLALLLGMAAAASAQTYYVSPAGNDANDGLSQARPWKTAAKVDASKFSPGATILFKRGGEWHESLVASSDGAPGRPITYGAYGSKSDPKPIFWGSDLIKNADFVSNGGSVYKVDGPAKNERGGYGCVWADHKFLHSAASVAEVGSKPDSWFAQGSTYYIHVASDPKNSKTVYSFAVRENIIMASDRHDLAFQDLIAQESARLNPADPGNNPEAYAIRTIRCSNIKMDGVEAISGGKHHFGIIDTTGFVGTHLHASGSVPGLPFGHVSGLVSYSDGSRHGDTSVYTDCTVDNFDGSQQALYSHGPGMGSLTINNLTCIGCGFALATENPNEAVTIKGGLTQGSVDLYASNVTIDGMKFEHAHLTLYGPHNTVENCIFVGASPQSAITSRTGQDILRNNSGQ